MQRSGHGPASSVASPIDDEDLFYGTRKPLVNGMFAGKRRGRPEKAVQSETVIARIGARVDGVAGSVRAQLPVVFR